MPATFKYYLRTDQPNSNGECSLYLRITHNRKMKYHNTGIKLHPSDWNSKRDEVRSGHRQADKINDTLDQLKERANQIRRELAMQLKENADAIKRILESSSSDDFFSLADEYLADLKSNGHYHTQRQSKVAIDKLKRFHNKKHLPVNLIDEAFLQRFVKFMQQPPYNNKASTIHKNIGAISAILDNATQLNMLPYNPTKNEGFKLPKKNGTTTKAKLTFEQIKQIENMQLKPGSNCWNARNAFILAFYFCGIRFGDLCMLRWENVSSGRLRYTMSKTDTDIDVKIPEGAKRFLELYDMKSDTDFILPFLSDMSKEDQKDGGYIRKRIASNNTIVNGCLKDIADQLEISESVSMHVARHSFAQYAVDEKKVPAYHLMILLGHSNIKTTMQYLKTINVSAADKTLDAIF